MTNKYINEISEERKLEFKSQISLLVKFLLRMSKKMGDRDNNICLAMTYENIEEYFEKFKFFISLTTYSTEDKLLKGIIRSFVMAQIACITHDKEEEHIEPMRVWLDEIIEEDFEELKAIMVMHWRTLLDDINKVHMNKIF